MYVPRSNIGASLNQRRGKEIHVIPDKLSAHKSAPVKEFLEAHPKVHLPFIPTYSSSPDQVGLWFDKIERDVKIDSHFGNPQRSTALR